MKCSQIVVNIILFTLLMFAYLSLVIGRCEITIVAAIMDSTRCENLQFTWRGGFIFLSLKGSYRIRLNYRGNGVNI